MTQTLSMLKLLEVLNKKVEILLSEKGSKKAETSLSIKTSKTIGKKHKILYTAQLNLYNSALTHNFMEDWKFGKIPDRLYILHLKKDGNYRLIKIPIETDLANACITLHYALK